MDTARIQSILRDQRIDAWLVYDFRASSAVFARLLPPPEGHRRFTTRRLFLVIPAAGEPVLLAHTLDASGLEREGHPGLRIRTYTSWRQLRESLEALVSNARRVAMEYAPGGTLPVVSSVDAGTVELVRALGVEVVSSADVMQAAAAAWSEAAVAAHAAASAQVAQVKDEAFAIIRDRLASGTPVTEHEVADVIRQRFGALALEYPDGPIVAANAHAADPHYEPGPDHPTPIRRGDWILIDLWARRPGNDNIFADITWVASAGAPSRRQQDVFAAVAGARDAAVERAQRAFAARERVEGWQLDDAARAVLEQAGLADAIRHRTGHSLSPGALVHGLGMNLDNLETHDTRAMLPGLGFTVEPGAYLPAEHFGIRSEINLYVDPARGPVITGPVQSAIVTLA